MFDRYADPNERLALILCAVFSAFAYLLVCATIIGIPYLALGAMFFAIVEGCVLGALRGNGVKVTPSQFPAVHRFATDIARQMNFPALPDIVVVQEGGLLNAFATRFFGRNFVVIYSDILELAIDQGEAEVAFVVAHEMAHLYRKHTIWKAFLYPAMLVPFAGVAYSRCCEYTADAIATAIVPDGAVNGLLVLAAGKQLYRHVDPGTFAAQAGEAHRSFWITVAELLSTHPILPKRLVRVGEALSRNSARVRSLTDAAANVPAVR
jgi:Zn-dependent protease with chaperone function